MYKYITSGIYKHYPQSGWTVESNSYTYLDVPEDLHSERATAEYMTHYSNTPSPPTS